MENFLIRYEDIYSLLWAYQRNLEAHLEGIAAEEDAFRAVIENTQFQGHTANSIKNYLNEVHMTMLASMRGLAQCLLDSIVIYKAGYYPIDESTNFVLPEEGMSDMQEYLRSDWRNAEYSGQRIDEAINSIRDLISFTKPDREEIETAINWEVSSLIEGCKTNVGEHERTTVQELEKSVDVLLKVFEECLSNIEDKYAVIGGFERGSFFGEQSTWQMASIGLAYHQVHEQNSAAIEQIWQAESAMAECSEYGQAVV